MIEKCGKVEVGCGWNSFSVREVWNFPVSLRERKLCPLKICLKSAT